MYKKILTTLKEEISAQGAFSYLEDICKYHRIQCSPGIRQAAIYCQDALKKAGLEAQLLSYPADGQHNYFTAVPPQEWEITSAELFLIDGQGKKRRLSRFADCSHCVVQRSKGTAATGLEGAVIAVEKADQKESYQNIDVRGKWVLTDIPPQKVKKWAVDEGGALGIITDAMAVNPPLREAFSLGNSHQYHAFWGSNASENAVGFVLTPYQGRELRQRLLKGEELKLKGIVTADFYPGTLENVTAVIPGSLEGEILLIAHICHPRPSANDNASGAAVLLEVARALRTLIQQGLLSTPRYSIRFLFVPEMTGTYAYFSTEKEAKQKIIAALNLDMVGGRQEQEGGTLMVEKPPLSTPSFAQDLLQAILEQAFAQNKNVGGTATYPGFRTGVMPFSGGSDHYIIADPTINIPCPMLIQWPDKYYHTCSDTTDKIDLNILKRVALLAGTYAFFLASAKREDVSWLADRMIGNFAAEIAGKTNEFLAFEGEFSLAKILNYLAFRKERKIADLYALKRLYNDSSFEESIFTAVELTKDILKTQQTRVANYNLHSPLKKEEAKVELGENIIPKRLYSGPIASQTFYHRFQKLAPARINAFEKLQDQHQKRVQGNIYGVLLLYWMDGERTLAEILNLLALETNEEDREYALAYCELLKELGFITIEAIN